MKYTAVLLCAALLCTAVFCGCEKENFADSNSSASSSKIESEVNSVLSNPEPASILSAESSENEINYVEAKWFDDAVFIGDSVTLKLSYYSDNGSLGKANFLCEGSLGYGNALWDLKAKGNVHPSYEGKKYTVDEGAKMLKSKKIFIMFGMNDIGLYGIEDSVKNMEKLTDRVVKKNPEAKIYIESVTPMLEKSQMKDLNNKLIGSFNDKIKEVCGKRGYTYIDVASVMKDKKGNLKPEYCSDPEGMGLHFTDDGCKVWVEYLKRSVE